MTATPSAHASRSSFAMPREWPFSRGKAGCPTQPLLSVCASAQSRRRVAEQDEGAPRVKVAHRAFGLERRIAYGHRVALIEQAAEHLHGHQRLVARRAHV